MGDKRESPKHRPPQGGNEPAPSPPSAADQAGPDPFDSTVRVFRLTLLFAFGVAVVAFLRFTGALTLVGLGFLATASITSMLLPLARKLPLKRGWGAVVTGVGFLLTVAGILTLLGWLLVEPVRRQLRQLPELLEAVNDGLIFISESLGFEEPLTLGALVLQAQEFFTGQGGRDLVARTSDLAVNILIVLALLFIGTIYLLAESNRGLLNPVLALAPERHRTALRGIVHDLEPRLRWWVIGTVISMVLVGTTSWIGYTLVGLPFTGPLALLAGLAEIVPTVGPAFTLVVALLLASTLGTTEVIGVVIVYLIIQTLEAYVITPLVMRRAVHIPPVVSLFTIVLWGKTLGVGGLLLAIPINLTLWTILDHTVIRRHPPVKRPP